MEELEALLVEKYGVPADRARDAAEQIIMRGRVETFVDRERSRNQPGNESEGWISEGRPDVIPMGVSAAANSRDSGYNRRTYPSTVMEAEALERVANRENTRMRSLGTFGRVFSPHEPDRREAIEYRTPEAKRLYPEYLKNYESFMGPPTHRRESLMKAYDALMAQDARVAGR